MGFGFCGKRTWNFQSRRRFSRTDGFCDSNGNLKTICDKYSPSVKAYLLIPLVGSLFADFLNSLVITVFINFI